MDKSQTPHNPAQDAEVFIPKYAWVILFVAFLASVAAPLNQFKVPPVMPLLMEQFSLDMGMAGLLMSMFAITGFILALPSGIIAQRLGLKITGLIALGCLMIGSAIGAISNSSGVLLFSRVIEGVGMGLLAVVAPAAIAMWFPPQKIGLPMGIWATWVPVGSILMFLIAPALSESFGLQSIWWFGAGFAAAAFVLYALFMRMPPAASHSEGQNIDESLTNETIDLRKALSNRSIWMLGLGFASYNVVLLAVNTFYPTFLSTELGFSMASASFTTSIVMMVTLFSAPLAGLLSDRIGSRKLVFSVPFVFLALLMLLPFTIASSMVPVFMIVLGVINGAIPTAIFAAAPEIMGRRQLAGIGMAVVTLGGNLGMFIGPALFGSLVEKIGWATTGYWMIPVLLIGLVACLLVKIR